jgi:hypothetical protein
MTAKAQIVAINQLLSDMYQRKMRLSYLLAEMDFQEAEIQLIASQLLTETIDNFIQSLQEITTDFHDGQRLFDIIHSNYGLDGSNPKTLQQSGNKLEISRERVRQLKEKAIKKLRVPNNLIKRENHFKSKTSELLKQNFDFDNCVSSVNDDNSYLEKQMPYIFKICQSESGCNHITIDHNDQNNSTAQIIITEDTLQFFLDELITTINLLGWKHNLQIQKTYSVNNIRQQYPRAYEKWMSEEDELLINKFQQGLSVEVIAASLERQPSAINSRLIKLGLKQ